MPAHGLGGHRRLPQDCRRGGGLLDRRRLDGRHRHHLEDPARRLVGDLRTAGLGLDAHTRHVAGVMAPAAPMGDGRRTGAAPQHRGPHPIAAPGAAVPDA